MAIDTQAKRASALWIVQPDGTIAQADRQTVLRVYGGILAGAPGVPVVVKQFSARSTVMTLYTKPVYVISEYAGATEVTSEYAATSRV